MSITPQSAKAKGSRLERKVAQVIGGKRAPLSGAVGGGDVWTEADSIWNDWSWELKARKEIPALIKGAFKQAQDAIGVGGRKMPAVVIQEDRGKQIFCCYLTDLKRWAEALAEVGAGPALKSYIRSMRRMLDDMEKQI